MTWRLDKGPFIKYVRKISQKKPNIFNLLIRTHTVKGH